MAGQIFVCAIPYQLSYRLSPRVSSSLQSTVSIRPSRSRFPRGFRRCKPVGRLHGTNTDLLNQCVLVRYYRPPIRPALTITSGRALPAGRQLCCDLALNIDVLHIQRVSTARVSLCYRLMCSLSVQRRVKLDAADFGVLTYVGGTWRPVYVDITRRHPRCHPWLRNRQRQAVPVKMVSLLGFQHSFRNLYCLCTLSHTIVSAAAFDLLQMVAVLGTTCTLKAVYQTQMAHLASLARNPT